MDQSTHPQQLVMGSVGGTASIPYGTPYQSAPLIPSSTHGPIPPPPSFPTPSMSYQQVQHLHHQQHQQQLQRFWSKQIEEIEQITDFKNHSLPLARIKKIMKADEDVRMISAEAPVVFAKACEMFILELTLRAWIHTEENKRRTLQKNDIAAAISRTDIFDFLVDIVPRDELKEEGLGAPRVPTDSIPLYYAPPPHGAPVPGPGMMMGKPVDQAGAPVYAVPQTQQPVTYMSWPQPLPSQPQQPEEQEPSDE